MPPNGSSCLALISYSCFAWVQNLLFFVNAAPSRQVAWLSKHQRFVRQMSCTRDVKAIMHENRVEIHTGRLPIPLDLSFYLLARLHLELARYTTLSTDLSILLTRITIACAYETPLFSLTKSLDNNRRLHRKRSVIGVDQPAWTTSSSEHSTRPQIRWRRC